MMQRTIRGELTRLLRTNSSVDSFEQEVKFFRLKWTRRGHDGKELDRIAKSCPWLAKKTLVGDPKEVEPKPSVHKKQHSKSLRFFPFGRVINKHVKVVQRFLGHECKPIVARTTSSNECTVSRGRTADRRVRVECLFQFFGFLVLSEVTSRFHQSASRRDRQPARVSGFSPGKTCACREQQKVWCQIFHISQET